MEQTARPDPTDDWLYRGYFAADGTGRARIEGRDGGDYDLEVAPDEALDRVGIPTEVGWGYFGTGPLVLAGALIRDAIPAHLRWPGDEDFLLSQWIACLNADEGWTCTRSDLIGRLRSQRSETH